MLTPAGLTLTVKTEPDTFMVVGKPGWRVEILGNMPSCVPLEKVLLAVPFMVIVELLASTELAAAGVLGLPVVRTSGPPAERNTSPPAVAEPEVRTLLTVRAPIASTATVPLVPEVNVLRASIVPT